MRGKEDAKIVTLRWYLDFIQDDLDAMSDLEFSKRVLEVQHYFQSIPMLTLIGDNPVVYVGWPDRGRLSQPVPLWPGLNYPWKENLKFVQKELKGFLTGLMKPFGPFSEILEGNVIVSIIPTSDGAMNLGFIFTDFTPGVSKEFFTPQKLAQMAKLSFSASIAGVPLNGVGKGVRICEECGRYFLHLSERERKFCSPRCTTKVTSRRRRTSDPDAYRAYQREIMKRKYRKKRAKERGVSPNLVRIQKRSRRKRNEE
jgi:hypothetical protein